ncbi:MAG: hypothetical protein NPMRD2_2170001 [Nitrosopumilales archaeon]|jgi:hypothetical protein|nr:MAG: hypothetical protein NPMRD2_2170001 [Nitrosopumilales archaeon]
MDEYFKSLLTQISETYNFLKEMKDKPGDLDIIKVQQSKIQGLIKVLCNKIETLHNESDDFSELLKVAKTYLKNYDFYDIIDTYQLYSEDVMRIKNIRISILSSLEETKLISKIQSMLQHWDS